ncbi:MAG: hypothetical protein ABIM42_06730 [candidate division WOR-3 bacterium]
MEYASEALIAKWKNFAILKDLAYEISELVRESTSMRRTIHKGLPLP